MPIDAYFDTGLFDDSLFDTFEPPIYYPVPTIYAGKSARIYIWQHLGTGDTSPLTQSSLGLSDVDISINRNVVEQSLIGENGNLFVPGSISVDGSFTACKLDNTFAGTLLGAIVSGNYFVISGMIGEKSLSFYMVSCLVTSFDLDLGGADNITEGSIDFLIADPANIIVKNKQNNQGMFLTDVA